MGGTVRAVIDVQARAFMHRHDGQFACSQHSGPPACVPLHKGQEMGRLLMQNSLIEEWVGAHLDIVRALVVHMLTCALDGMECGRRGAW